MYNMAVRRWKTMIETYLNWCKEKGLKPCQASNLQRFISQTPRA